ncbi:hypothetical protein V8E36_000575 [Tilletia maclaganii]
MQNIRFILLLSMIALVAALPSPSAPNPEHAASSTFPQTKRKHPVPVDDDSSDPTGVRDPTGPPGKARRFSFGSEFRTAHTAGEADVPIRYQKHKQEERRVTEQHRPLPKSGTVAGDVVGFGWQPDGKGSIWG